jgi:DHA1 family bicyclomycin/chloramphenicol resistance-like MFS transporter
MTSETMVQRSHFGLILFLGILNALTPFTIDLYLPAFSDIARDLQTTVPRVSLSVATYFIGFALGQILYGPLLDRFGRKSPLILGMLLYIGASVGCMTAQSVEALWIFRFLAALGGSASSVGAITMVRDYFDPKEGAKVFSMLMLVLSVSPLFAPSIGGWISATAGWRVIFAVLTALALINVAIVIWGLPKVYAPDSSVSLKAVSVVRSYWNILKVAEFRVPTLAGAFSFAGLFVYLTGSPAIFIDGFQVSKQIFGLIFALLAVAMIGGGQVNNLLLKKYESSVIFQRAILCQILVSVLFLLAVVFTTLSMIPTIAFFFLLLGCSGIAYPNAASLALRSVTQNVGSASALLGFLQMGLGAILAALVGLMDIKGTLPTVVVMCLSAVLAGAVLMAGRKSLN